MYNPWLYSNLIFLYHHFFILLFQKSTPHQKKRKSFLNSDFIRLFRLFTKNTKYKSLFQQYSFFKALCCQNGDPVSLALVLVSVSSGFSSVSFLSNGELKKVLDWCQASGKELQRTFVSVHSGENLKSRFWQETFCWQGIFCSLLVLNKRYFCQNDWFIFLSDRAFGVFFF